MPALRAGNYYSTFKNLKYMPKISVYKVFKHLKLSIHLGVIFPRYRSVP